MFISTEIEILGIKLDQIIEMLEKGPSHYHVWPGAHGTISGSKATNWGLPPNLEPGLNATLNAFRAELTNCLTRLRSLESAPQNTKNLEARIQGLENSAIDPQAQKALARLSTRIDCLRVTINAINNDLDDHILNQKLHKRNES